MIRVHVKFMYFGTDHPPANYMYVLLALSELLYVWDEQKLSKSIILRSEIWKKFFSGICKSKSEI